MSMGDDEAKEQQVQELEVLESIYSADELRILDRDYPNITLEVKIPFEDKRHEASPDPIVLRVDFPSRYPSTAPKIEVRGLENIWPNSSISLQRDIEAVADDNVGMPIVFTLASSLQDILANYASDRSDKETRRVEKERVRIEMEERARFEGDRVTAEKFNEWKAKFFAELNALKKVEARTDETAGRLTGKQLFLRDATLAMSDLQILNSGDDQQVEVDEALFTDDLDINIDNDSE